MEGAEKMETRKSKEMKKNIVMGGIVLIITILLYLCILVNLRM